MRASSDTSPRSTAWAAWTGMATRPASTVTTERTTRHTTMFHPTSIGPIPRERKRSSDAVRVGWVCACTRRNIASRTRRSAALSRAHGPARSGDDDGRRGPDSEVQGLRPSGKALGDRTIGVGQSVGPLPHVAALGDELIDQRAHALVGSPLGQSHEFRHGGPREPEAGRVRIRGADRVRRKPRATVQNRADAGVGDVHAVEADGAGVRSRHGQQLERGSWGHAGSHRCGRSRREVGAHEQARVSALALRHHHDDVGDVPGRDPVQGPVQAPPTRHSCRHRVGATRPPDVREGHRAEQLSGPKTRQQLPAQTLRRRFDGSRGRPLQRAHRGLVLHPAEPGAGVASGEHLGELPLEGRLREVSRAAPPPRAHRASSAAPRTGRRRLRSRRRAAITSSCRSREALAARADRVDRRERVGRGWRKGLGRAHPRHATDLPRGSGGWATALPFVDGSP